MSSTDPQQPYGYDPQQPHRYDPYPGQPYPYQQPYGSGYPEPLPLTPYGYEYPQQPQDTGLRGWAIGALVTNIALTMLCCSPLGIAGIVVSALAMGRADHQPESARSLLRWAWGLVIASAVLGAVLIVGFVVLVVVSEPQ